MIRFDGTTAILEALQHLIRSDRNGAPAGGYELFVFDVAGQLVASAAHGDDLPSWNFEFDHEGRPRKPLGSGEFHHASLDALGHPVGFVSIVAPNPVPGLEVLCRTAARLLNLVLTQNYELDDLAEALGRFFEERMFLYEITAELGQATDESEFCCCLARRVSQVTQARRTLVLLTHDDGCLRLVGSHGLMGEWLGISGEAEGGLARRAIDGRATRLLELVDANQRGDLSMLEREADRALLAVPLGVGQDEAPIGAIVVMDGGRAGVFTSEEERLLQFIAEYVCSLLTGIRLVELTKELQIAQRIVEGLLPSGSPSIPGYEIAGRLVPAHTIGGDYFDFIPLSEDSLAIAIADVSGHTLPAALMMAVSRSGVRWEIRPGCGPHEVMHRVAANLYDDLASAEFFLSMFLVILEPGGVVRYANAGHPPALVHRPRTGQFIELDAEGMIAGVVREVTFEERRCRMQPGDLLVLFTDGVTEAGGPHPERQFGMERLRQVVGEAARRRDTPSNVLQAIFEAVTRHSGESRQDDVTVVVVKACAQGAEWAEGRARGTQVGWSAELSRGDR
ncbi:MAG: SpoIIE family protein phosphatase [Planctomycetes bacterium]|nr:SpoIIE family protein phosphatase [Planctomycetota bacterium]